MAFTRPSTRRIPAGVALGRALLDAREPLTFDELLTVAGAHSPGDVAAWLGHAIQEGLVREETAAPGDRARFSLKSRGRRLIMAGRRAEERER